ncbi:hypothetical protein F5146DRAFT_1051591 [Armillaria mellea]|nr:hypothetical protein F5146DRAFT_1051591 [Armillaria mellea]
MRTTRHFRQDLLRELKKYDLQGLIRERGWNTDDPTFIDGTSVATTLHVHHKYVISNALQSVCPGEIIPSELVRESRQTIYMFCSLLHDDLLKDFHRYLQERLQHPTFSDGIYVHEEYNLVTTPILQWLCREHIKDNTIPSRLTRADCLYHLQFPQRESIRSLIHSRHVASRNPTFDDNTPVVDVLRGLLLYQSSRERIRWK